MPGPLLLHIWQAKCPIIHETGNIGLSTIFISWKSEVSRIVGQLALINLPLVYLSINKVFQVINQVFFFLNESFHSPPNCSARPRSSKNSRLKLGAIVSNAHGTERVHISPWCLVACVPHIVTWSINRQSRFLRLLGVWRAKYVAWTHYSNFFFLIFIQNYVNQDRVRGAEASSTPTFTTSKTEFKFPSINSDEDIKGGMWGQLGWDVGFTSKEDGNRRKTRDCLWKFGVIYDRPSVTLSGKVLKGPFHVWQEEVVAII